MSAFIETLVGKRAKFRDRPFYTTDQEWLPIEEVRESDEEYLVIFPAGRCQDHYDKHGRCLIDRAYDLVVHPDDLQTKPKRTRKDILAEMATLQKELDSIPEEFPDTEYYIGWEKSGRTAQSLARSADTMNDWPHISKVRLVEVERIR